MAPICSGSFAWLGSHPSLATRKDATVQVVPATSHKCFPSCVCDLAHWGGHLYSKRQLRKNHNFGTATRVEIMQCNKGEAKL